MKAFHFLAIACLTIAISTGAMAADVAAGETRFRQLCANCHGNTGQGDGPASRGLRPRPANMAEAEWQASVDDDYLRQIITRGGASVGKSPMMTGFGHTLRGDDLDNVIAFIRSLAD